MHHQTLAACLTSLEPAAVLGAAKEFFGRRPSIYAAFVEREGPGYVTLRGQGGEEIVIAAQAAGDRGATQVTGSSYLFAGQIARFLSTLPPAAATAGARA